MSLSLASFVKIGAVKTYVIGVKDISPSFLRFYEVWENFGTEDVNKNILSDYVFRENWRRK